MIKALILAFDFPPKPSVGGERPASWMKFFPKYGVEPTIITLDQLYTSDQNKRIIDPKNNVIWTKIQKNLRDRFLDRFGEKFSPIRKMISIWVYFFEFLSFKYDDKREIYFEAKKLLKQKEYDIIIATGEPFILFKYADLLSKEFNIPWIADYRDDWIDDPSNLSRSKFTRIIFNLRNRNLEKQYLSSASGITSVNEDIITKINSRLKKYSYKSAVILNGFDVDLLKNDLIVEESNNEFIISYAGVMYDFDYFNPFKEAFTNFMQKEGVPKNVKVHFYGILKNPNRATEDVLKLKNIFPKNIEVFDYIAQNELIGKLKNSSVFLNLIAADASKGYIGTKIFMYAALKKPIISIPLVDCATTDFFPNRNIHFMSRQPLEIENLIRSFYIKFKTDGIVKSDIREEEIYNLSREKTAKDLVLFINKLRNESEKNT
jgi:hypothetical protein